MKAYTGQFGKEGAGAPRKTGSGMKYYCFLLFDCVCSCTFIFHM